MCIQRGHAAPAGPPYSQADLCTASREAAPALRPTSSYTCTGELHHQSGLKGVGSILIRGVGRKAEGSGQWGQDSYYVLNVDQSIRCSRSVSAWSKTEYFFFSASYMSAHADHECIVGIHTLFLTLHDAERRSSNRLTSN